MKITETKTVTETRDVEVAPCLKCGGTDIKISDFGYFQGNSGGGTCGTCGHEVFSRCGDSPSVDVLVGIWNKGNDIVSLIAVEQATITQSTERIETLRALQAARNAQASGESLGEVLKKLKKRSSAEKLEQETRARAAQDEAVQRELDSVEAFFEGAKRHIEAALGNGREPAPYQLGQSGRNMQHHDAYLAMKGYDSTPLQTRLDSGKYMYCVLWNEFKAWAQANQLKAELAYQYDGGGVHGWYELAISPAEEA